MYRVVSVFVKNLNDEMFVSHELKGEDCGGYGRDGMQSEGYDFVNLPGAKTVDLARFTNSNRCGRKSGLHTRGPRGENSICSESIQLDSSLR